MSTYLRSAWFQLKEVVCRLLSRAQRPLVYTSLSLKIGGELAVVYMKVWRMLNYPTSLISTKEALDCFEFKVSKSTKQLNNQLVVCSQLVTEGEINHLTVSRSIILVGKTCYVSSYASTAPKQR
jgi:hypothetical protein